MTTKDIIDLVRSGIAVGNAAKVCNIDLNRLNTEVVQDFITFCNNVSPETVVPDEMAAAWEAVPEIWCVEGAVIPLVHEDASYEECKKFGNPGQKMCAACAETDPDRAIRCHARKAELDAEAAAKAAEKDAAKAAKAAEKDAAKAAKEAEKAAAKAAKEAEKAAAKAAKEAEKAAAKTEKPEKTPKKPKVEVPPSRYGHRGGSMSASIDEMVFAGTLHSAIVQQLVKDHDVDEKKASAKVTAHVGYLPKHRGVVVTVTRTDDDTHYKADAEAGSKNDTAGVYSKLENVIVDNRSEAVKAAEKEALTKRAESLVAANKARAAAKAAEKAAPPAA